MVKMRLETFFILDDLYLQKETQKKTHTQVTNVHINHEARHSNDSLYRFQYNKNIRYLYNKIFQPGL